MKRHARILLGWTLLVLLAQLTVGASTAFARTWNCMVINDRINSTIYDNIALDKGGGIYGPSAALTNCVPGNEGYEGVNVFSNYPEDINW